jgi:choline dehydrogenase-like flavoprotein
MAKTLEAVDAVVVGSGAAGSVYAAVLAEAGKDVLVLERGRERKLTDLYSSQIWARRLKWGSPHVEEQGPDSIWYNFNAGHGTGGAAIHHFAVWPRYHEEDFLEQTLYKRSLDWPFEYDVLRPFYDQVQSDVGMSGDAEKEIWRPPGDPYPMPPVLVSNHGRVLARGFAALDMHTAPIPMAILTQPYNGRPPCIWDGWCDAGCPIGALANPLVVYLPRAQQAGARLQGNAHVTRVLTDESGRHATGVEYYTADGEQVIQPADVVVLCAFTVENVRILLNSGNKNHPDGLSNSSRLLGRYLMSHPAVMVHGMFDQEMENYLGATGGQLLCQDGYDKHSDPGGAFGSSQWEIGLAVKPNDLLGISMSRPDIFGEDLHEFMREGAHYLGSMVAVVEDEPMPENRIELSENSDKFGMPRAKVFYQTSAEGRKLWHTVAAKGVEIMNAAGAQEGWHGPQGAQHIMGGTVLGRDPSKSVLDANAQSHDVSNLYVGGPSVFPTSSCINSTFTAHAVAMKSARHIVENWS